MVTLERNIRELVKLVREDGAIPILLTQAFNIPPNYSKDAFYKNALGYNNPTNYNRNPVELWGEVAYVAEGIRKNNETIRRIASEENAMLIDQDAMLSHDITNFGDVVHLSEEGTDRFVKYVTDLFVRQQLLEPTGVVLSEGAERGQK
jgi:hypothetical protein